MIVKLAEGPVHGRVDAALRLIEADAQLAALHVRAGGERGGVIAVPQIASLVRTVRRLGIAVSRGVAAADGDLDLDLWIRAQPEGDDVRLAIVGWTERPARAAEQADEAAREHDFRRAGADWVWETDAALLLTALSSNAAALIEANPADLLGQPLTALFGLDEGAEGAFPILNAMAEQQRFSDQRAHLRRGARQPMVLTGVPLIDGNGRFAGFRGTASLFEGAPAAAPAADEARPPDAFGERLDQALRAPLDRIVAGAENIRAQNNGPLRRDYVDYAADIATAGRHLLALVDDLVDLQAIERPDFVPQPETIDLADVARRAAGLLGVRAGEKDIRIDRPAADETLPAKGEFRRALQILMNLIGNAVRYSPEGGMIWIRAERDGDHAAVIVADQGKGIAPEDQQRIFEKFERLDASEPGGTGLGLYIARRLARAMGGDLTVDSAPGQGARFMLTLPAA